MSTDDTKPECSDPQEGPGPRGREEITRLPPGANPGDTALAPVSERISLPTEGETEPLSLNAFKQALAAFGDAAEERDPQEYDRLWMRLVGSYRWFTRTARPAVSSEEGLLDPETVEREVWAMLQTSGGNAHPDAVGEFSQRIAAAFTAAQERVRVLEAGLRDGAEHHDLCTRRVRTGEWTCHRNCEVARLLAPEKATAGETSPP